MKDETAVLKDLQGKIEQNESFSYKERLIACHVGILSLNKEDEVSEKVSSESSGQMPYHRSLFFTAADRLTQLPTLIYEMLCESAQPFPHTFHSCEILLCFLWLFFQKGDLFLSSEWKYLPHLVEDCEEYLYSALEKLGRSCDSM